MSRERRQRTERRGRHRPSAIACRALILLAAAAATLGGAPARAEKPAPQWSPAEAMIAHRPPAPERASTPPCTFGEVGPAVFSVNYIVPPGDAYYVLLAAGSCGTCLPPDTSLASTVHIALQFPSACSQPVAVSVVGTSGPSSCQVPDPAQVLCQEIQYDLVPGTPGTYDFAIPLPAACPLTADAFLRVSFVSDGVGCATLETRPRLLTTGVCSNCQNYNIYPGGNADLCALNFPGSLVMYVDVLSCAVPVLARSWGGIKIRYR